MKEETITTITVIALLGSIALEAFMIGQSRIFDSYIKFNHPLFYSIFNQVLIVGLTGFVVFFVLGAVTLTIGGEKNDMS